MQQATIGTKYQIVIPKAIRNKVKGLTPGTKVKVSSLDSQTVEIKKVELNWVERTRGIATEAWKGIDTTAELEKMRNEWDRKS